MSEKNTYVFPIELLADMSAREPFLESSPETYRKAIMTDVPVTVVTSVLKALRTQGYFIGIIANRCKTDLFITEGWLRKNGIPFSWTSCPAPGYSLSYSLWKQGQASESRYRDRVCAVFENDPLSVKLWRESGVHSFLFSEGWK